MRIVACLFLVLASLPTRVAASPGGALQVLGVEGGSRLFRFETEPWPLEPGRPLPDNSRVELDKGAKLRLRFGQTVDFCLAGPARLTVYVVPAPAVGELEQDRVVLNLDEGALLVDGRFQFGRPADIVLSLPDQSVPLPKDERFVAVAKGGQSELYRVRLDPTPSAQRVMPGQDGAAGRLVPSTLKASRGEPFPPELYRELDQPVTVFVLARDFNQDLGTWPRPAVLGPLLSERLAKLKGVRVVEGSGSTFHSYRANGALKSGADAYLKDLARAQGARWVLAGNVVAESLRDRRVQGQAELRLLETEGEDGGLELVSEAGNTRVARDGRALELAAREAMEAASLEAARHLEWQLGNLLQGKAHAQFVLKLVLEGADAKALEELRARLAAMDTVQKVFRRAYAGKVARFDLILRRSLADFDAQWTAFPVQSRRFIAVGSDETERRYRAANSEEQP